MIQDIGRPVSRHAVDRCNSRGIRWAMIAQVFDHHDRDVAVGGACRALSLSASALLGLQRSGTPVHEVESLRRLVIVWSDRSAQVVTAFRARKGRAAGRYLRQS